MANPRKPTPAPATTAANVALFETLLAAAPVITWAVDRDGTFLRSEGQGLAKLGLVPGQLVGRCVFDFYADETALIESVRRTLAGETLTTTVALTNGASWESHCVPLRDSHGAVVGAAGIAWDVTTRAQTERQLRDSEERYRSLIEFATDAILVESEGKIVFANRSAAALLDVDHPRTLLGRSLIDFLPPEKHAWFADVTNRVLAGGLIGTPIRTRSARTDGTFRPIEVACIPIRYLGREALHVNVRDATTSVDADAQLRESLRIAGISHTAIDIAHNLNNLLTAIRGNADLLRDDSPQDRRFVECIGEILDATRQAGELAHRLLLFGRRSGGDSKVLDLNLLATEVAATLRRALVGNIELRAVTHPTAVLVKAAKPRLRQALLSLACNAIDAMPQGGSLQLAVDRRRLTADQADATFHGAAGFYAVVEVTDTGVGIEPTERQRIFQPLVTAKNDDEALGLGLAIVRATVTDFGGTVQVDSEVGRGTTVRLLLPCAEGATDDESLPPTSTSPKRVLVVEGDAGVRGLVTHVLERQGYLVLEASRPSDALSRCVGEGGLIHLLLVDTVMPLMSGHELARRAQSLHPEMQVIYMSSHADDASLSGPRLLLRKPFSSTELLQIVRTALDQAR